MSLPRRVLPGLTYLVTRRTTRRFFLLRPDADACLSNAYWYVTAVLAEELGIELHATQMLSTHMHEVLTDTRGVLPRFLQKRNRVLAEFIKLHRGWPEEVFARGSPNCVQLYGSAAMLRKIGYTIANCVEAGLVSRPAMWPGVSAVVGERRRVIRVRRPSLYFDVERRRWPEFAEIELVMPRILEQQLGERAPGVVRSAVRAAVIAARRRVRARGGRFAAPVSLTRISHETRATSDDGVSSRAPHFATDGMQQLRALAVAERRHFLTQYRLALSRAQRGRRPTFPEGTWRLHTDYGFRRKTPGGKPERGKPERRSSLAALAAWRARPAVARMGVTRTSGAETRARGSTLGRGGARRTRGPP